MSGRRKDYTPLKKCISKDEFKKSCGHGSFLFKDEKSGKYIVLFSETTSYEDMTGSSNMGTARYFTKHEKNWYTREYKSLKDAFWSAPDPLYVCGCLRDKINNEM